MEQRQLFSFQEDGQCVGYHSASAQGFQAGDRLVGSLMAACGDASVNGGVSLSPKQWFAPAATLLKTRTTP